MGLVVCDAVLDDTHVVVLAVPSDGWLHVIGLVHACEEAEVVEDGHELVCLVVLQLVAPPVLDERELRVDALADRGRGRLGEDETRHVLQLARGSSHRWRPTTGRRASSRHLP